jgi:hypothetical protein
MSPQIIGTRFANALVQDAEVSLPDIPGLDSITPGIDTVPYVVSVFKKAYGGLWVGGRATLATTELSFRPNAANRAFHTGTLDIAVPLSAIAGVEVLGGFVTKIIAVRTPRFVVKIRCYGATAFADQIRSAAHHCRRG